MTLYGEMERARNCVLRIPCLWQDMQKDSRKGHLSFLGPGSEKKWYGSNTYKPSGERDDVAEDMLLSLRESGHPVFRGTSALERGTLKSKGSGTLSFRFSGDPQIVEVFFRSIISVNQLSIYGAVADMCEELASQISDCSASTGRLVAKDKPETMVAPTHFVDHD